MSNIYDMNGKKKVIITEDPPVNITYKEIMKIVVENATEEALIEKDKEIAYLKGKVDTMQDVIKELNAPIEITQEK